MFTRAPLFRLGMLLVVFAAPAAAAPPSKPPADQAEIDARFQKWKAGLAPQQQAWEKTLEDNLGSFYLPLYKRGRVSGQVSAWDYVTDDPRLPRVLLIGDSISRGYTLAVRQQLAGKANVHRAPENCGGTANGLKKLDIWLAGGRWDVIHFNFGIHDARTSPADYRQRLEQIVARLEKTGARLVWASTTPVSPTVKGVADSALVERNRIAAEVMGRHGVAIDDLYAHILPDLAKLQNPTDCHFSGEGYQRLGTKVAQSIAPLLAPGRNK